MPYPQSGTFPGPLDFPGIFADQAQSRTLALAGSGSVNEIPSAIPGLSGRGNVAVIQGLQIAQQGNGYFYITKYVGEPNIPQDIKRMRRSIYDLMRRMGTPVLVKHMYTVRDEQNGYAERSANFNEVYAQTRNEDPLSYGTGYCSVEKSEDEYIDAHGQVFQSDVDVSAQFPRAPKYRGYGPGFLTYIIEPDAAEDYYKPNSEGVFIKIQEATAQAMWYPDMNDNDLIIQVTVDDKGNISSTSDRFVAKMVNPISLRGNDRRGRSEYSGDQGNRYIINQNFQMSLVPRPNILNRVEWDR